MRPACPTAHLNTHRFSLVAPVYHYSSFSLASMHHQARPHFSILPHHFQRLFSLFFSASALSVYIASLQHCRSFWREASLSTALTSANKCTLALFHVPSFFATYLHTQTGRFLFIPFYPPPLFHLISNAYNYLSFSVYSIYLLYHHLFLRAAWKFTYTSTHTVCKDNRTMMGTGAG